tara:strand:- start:212 stop:718 length:507 start_codon:yes stop_codon:yes gene_type:complete
MSHLSLNTIQQFEDTLTPNQWDLITDIYSHSGGHMTVRDLIDAHGWNASELDGLVHSLEVLGVCAFDGIQTPTGDMLAVGLYRSTIAVLEDMEAARNTPEAIRIAELEVQVAKLESLLNSRKDTLHHANKGFAEERGVFYDAIDTLEANNAKLESTLQQLATVLHNRG